MSDDIPSLINPMDKGPTNAELNEEEMAELEAEDDLLDIEADVIEETDGDISEADEDDAESA